MFFNSKSYLRESMLWMVAFMLSVVLVKWVAARYAADSLQRVMALVPLVLAMIAGLWVELRQVARMDELQRLKYLIATVAGSMLTILFCGVAYVGEALQLWGRIAPIYTIAVLGAGFVVGWFAAQRRYG